MKKLVLGIVCLLFVTTDAFAQNYIEPAYSKEVTKGAWEATLYSRYIGEADVHRMSGQVQVSETELDLTYDFKLSNGLPIALSIVNRHLDIDNSTAVNLPNHLEGRTLGISTRFPIPFIKSDQYFMGLDVYPSLFTDGWSWEDGAFRVPFRTYLIYRRSEKFILVGGVHARPGYADQVLPLVGLIWKPNDRLSFNLASSEPNISYQLSENWKAFVEFGLTNEEYEVTRGIHKNVVLIHKSYSSGVGVRYTVKDSVDASLSVGGVFARRFEYRDTHQEVEPDPGVYAKAEVSARF